MPPAIDVRGKTFGRLTALFESGRSRREILWRCRCSCGTEVDVRSYSLRRGLTVSCGCAKLESQQRNKFKPRHGMSETQTHAVWLSMRQRCRNPRSTAYLNYGGRGISVCERWESFENFLADMGERPPAMELDRIDVNGNYTPENCRWATLTQQARNTRKTVRVEFRGETRPLRDWAELLGVKFATLYRRIVLKGEPANSAFARAPLPWRGGKTLT